MAITLEFCEHVASAAISHAVCQDVKISVCVLDAGGRQIILKRMDGASFGTADAAIFKAECAAGFGRSTFSFEKGLTDGRLPYLGMPGLVAMGGGLPIISPKSKLILGSIGISGASSQEDDRIASAALNETKDFYD